jgi:S-DNA-T family DNA segregation ATPase FtsK/SpoIIIE
MSNNIVFLRDLLEKLDLKDYDIPIVFGENTEGRIVVKDLADIPNILMAGATGTGKSVFLNSVIYTLLKNKTEEELKFVMIDPKQSSLPFWDGIPHLLHPVITNHNKFYTILKKCVDEMELRMDMDSIDDEPYILILVDEFSDLMLVDPNIPPLIYKLAEKGGEAKIHMILSTSSPWDRVIPQEGKDFFAGKLVGSMTSKDESEIVLGKGGAEELMGNGDMLYLNTETDESIRVQAPFVRYEECKILREELGEGDYNKDWVVEGSKIIISDELLEKAMKLKEDRNGKISTNILQRELKIGYSVAKSICERLKV